MTHEVSVQQPAGLVQNKPVEYQIKEDGRMLDTLRISKGRIEWRPRNHSARKARLIWAEFAELMGARVEYIGANHQGAGKSTDASRPAA